MNRVDTDLKWLRKLSTDIVSLVSLLIVFSFHVFTYFVMPPEGIMYDEL